MAKRKRRFRAPGISLAKLRKAEKRVVGLQRATANARAKAGELMESLLNAGATGITAFGLGWWSGKNKGVMPSIGDAVPADVLVAVGAHFLGLLGVGKMDTHFRAVGNGALATFAVRQGAKIAEAKPAKPLEGYQYDIQGQLPEYDDDDLDVEGMALEEEPGAFAGYEIV